MSSWFAKQARRELQFGSRIESALNLQPAFQSLSQSTVAKRRMGTRSLKSAMLRACPLNYRTLDTAFYALAIGALLHTLRPMVVLGGPFISLLGDIVPLAAAGITIWCCVPYTIAETHWMVVFSYVLLLFAGIFVALVLVNVVTFWSMARGPAVSWW